MKDIFVVEDSKFDRAKIKEILTSLEYSAEYFSEAEEVLEQLENINKNKLPQLMIVNIVLAGKLSGYQLAEKLKRKCDIPIIFLTADSKKKTLNQQLLNGDLFLNKPIDYHELKNNIKIIMEKKKIDHIIEEKVNEEIVKNLDQQIWYFKDPYTYKMVNHSYALFLGKKEEKFRDQYIYDILKPKEAEEVIAENIEIFLDKKDIKNEKWYKNSNGENRLLAIKKSPIFNAQGAVENIFCQAEDITEQNILENELRRNRDNLQRIIEAVPDMIFLINKNGDVLDLWTGDESKLLYPKKEALGKNIKEFLTEAAYATYQDKINTLFNQKNSVAFEYSLLIDNTRKYYEAKMLNLETEGQKQNIIVSVRDISERKKSSLKLEKLSREFETIFNNVENAIFLINVENEELKFQRLNTFHENATGLKTEDIKGKTPVEAFGKDFGEELETNYRQCLIEKKTISYEEELDLPAGKRIWLTKLTPVINDKGEAEKIVGTSLDITENKIKENEIQYLSFHDEMTGLYNRRYFENEMQRLDSSRELPITIMIADLDNLKYVNDNFGHQAGDDYIITAAQMITDSTRDEDIVARIGGDEFALILPDTASSEAQKIYQRIKSKQSKYLNGNNVINIFSISIGYSVKDTNELSLEEVFKAADKKMYVNKAENKK
ncbi:PAS domain S-box-containing protein/diguanylate cyclase (GGDEF)-like protein [Halanaerobium saccharolyticum]|uniref:Stage 0 sporulation protein A homolog n=1 Tax=Halanaerobium saccharolyticum TaxID=43595 RepID=A0A4R6RPP2_9FIRM|nr:diguanylate cyclase [Halanaerobium saccharolyticum]TDP88739.1 PAS domain S-box-containing protein/diguanylate cyclase (GGDEF)-like protein [Halanaerobium saccharolyticum]